MTLGSLVILHFSENVIWECNKFLVPGLDSCPIQAHYIHHNTEQDNFFLEYTEYIKL